MCGICGFNWSDKSLIEKMNSTLKHRGPDAGGSFTDKFVSLGHRRLAIIDLSPKGKQPMFNLEGTVAITFNGEIYNYKEIRKDLEREGHRFNSESDTEVILQAYKAYGPDCVKRFNGMWAFCIYDLEKKILFLSRDRAGKKPLYYCLNKGKFIFASELKAILDHGVSKKIDRIALEYYFSLGFIPEPYSIFASIRKLGRSQSMVLDLRTMDSDITTYWTLPEFSPLYNKKQLIEEGRLLLDNSVLMRKIADVPVGTFLSGGLDSSAITATVMKFKKEMHTFSIGFENSSKYWIKYDESDYARLMSKFLGTEHHHYYFNQKDFEEMIDKIAFAYDEPFWDFSAYPTAKVSQLAKKYVTVVLSGDGGDEVFGGYSMHKAAARIEQLRKMPQSLKGIGQAIANGGYNLTKKDIFLAAREGCRLMASENSDFYSKLLTKERYHSKEADSWYSKNLSELLKQYGSLTESIIKFDLLHRTLSDNFLVKVDRASMLYALEVRCPFLDYRIMEFSNRIPASYKVDMFGTKKIMRDIIRDRVPKKIVQRGKQGFMPPILDWLYGDFRGDLDNTLELLRRRKILSKKQESYLSKLLLITPTSEKETIIFGEKLYQYFAFGLWAERWLE